MRETNCGVSLIAMLATSSRSSERIDSEIALMYGHFTDLILFISHHRDETTVSPPTFFCGRDSLYAMLAYNVAGKVIKDGRGRWSSTH